MAQGDISQEFRLENIDGTRNYFIEEINQNDLMSKNHKKVCTALNYIEHLLILASVATGCVSIPAVATLVAIPIGIASSAVIFKIYANTARMKKYDN